MPDSCLSITYLFFFFFQAEDGIRDYKVTGVQVLFRSRERARFAAWYEFFPRSGVSVDRSATFKEAEAQLTRAAAMGFDVAYLPPIHPIGRTHRKGRNNTL